MRENVVFYYLVFQKTNQMSLQKKNNGAVKSCYEIKRPALRLESLRAIKSAILLAQTESGAKEEISEDQELKILQKLVKQREDRRRII